MQREIGINQLELGVQIDPPDIQSGQIEAAEIGARAVIEQDNPIKEFQVMGQAFGQQTALVANHDDECRSGHRVFLPACWRRHPNG